MIQGTMSNSGKSFLTAALCRIFVQDGLRAAPFKSQNMALNSYITADGLEIGRAQVMQAEAAGIEPTVDMNPILLKPTSQMGSQVIVRGEVMGNMRAMDYYRRKPELIPVIRESFDRLAGEYDVIVLEGAGSPAEINLRDHDIVNMGMAEIADAPVILVADIDRGGVFASLYGTVELLKPEERARIRGLVINKFRGDVKILEPGLRMIEERLHIPVIGVIPMEEIDLEDEDSLSSRLSGSKQMKKAEEMVDIAVIRLPHIANFTDYNVLERTKGVSLRYAGRKDLLGHPDCILIPGTKNTMEDLKWLRSSGLEEEICRQNREEQTLVIGICGGYQMLGEWLEDPLGVEGESGAVMHGMGLLPSVTVFEEQKTRTRIRGKLTGEAAAWLAVGCGDCEVSGYEIHMGTTRLAESEGNSVGRKAFPAVILTDGRMDGLVREDGLVFGSYLHGLFDYDRFAENLLRRLAEKKGISLDLDPENIRDYKNSQYDKLAGLVRRSLDMDAVYRILGESGDR
ncbi:MAG: cobyric acid synthase [Clostridiales bacterium]|nr:cobyric acid synthase [Clostridiales bacterium]